MTLAVLQAQDFSKSQCATGLRAALNVLDKWMASCEQACRVLRAEGLFFVGIDVIDGRLSEINVTSPTGIREVERLGGIPLADQTIARLSELLAAGAPSSQS